MTSLLHRFLSAGVLTVWGTTLLAFFFTGRISAYLHANFQPLTLLTGCILVAFAFLVLIAPETTSSHGSNARSTTRSVLASLFLVAPLFLAFVNTRDSFGAAAVSNRTYVQDLAQLPSAQPPSGSLAVGPLLPGEDPATTSSVNDNFALPKNKQGQVQAQVIDFLYATQLPEIREQLENKPVELIGQLMPAKTNNPKGDRFVVIRMVMTCCAADAQPVAIPVEPVERPQFPDMTWVRVGGEATFPLEGGQRKPLIQHATLEKIDPPKEPFLY